MTIVETNLINAMQFASLLVCKVVSVRFVYVITTNINSARLNSQSQDVYGSSPSKSVASASYSLSSRKGISWNIGPFETGAEPASRVLLTNYSSTCL